MQKNYPSYHNKVFTLIFISVLMKLLVAGLLELGNDEVYYWTYALQPDWNHFDHPPMVGWMIRLTTFNLNWVSEISLRLGGILGAGIATWFIFLIGSSLASPKAGWYAALIYQFAIYTSIISGLFILPDSPQMPLWTASLYCMSLLLFKPDAEKSLGLWALLGALIGLSVLCKVHGLYLWVGFGLTILFVHFKWIFNWRLYASIIITLLFLLPIVYWNYKYDFITYRFHADRVTHTHLQWDMLAREILGEFAYQNPIIFILIIVSLFAMLRRMIIFRKKGTATWLLCMSLPMILLFWSISLFNPTLPHWSGPAYIPLFLLAAIYLDKQTQKKMPGVLILAGGLLCITAFAAVILVRFSPVNYGSHDKENYGEYCPTLDLSGWKDFSNNFNQLVINDQSKGIMKADAAMVVHKWFPGGHLQFYTVRATGLRLVGIGELTDLHKFAWLNKSQQNLRIGDDAYCIVPSNLPFDVIANYGIYFTQIMPAVVINQTRNGSVVRYFYVYRLKGCKKIPVSILP